MRLQKYITEQKSFAELSEEIYSNCSKYIKEIKGAKGALVRTIAQFGITSKGAVIKKKTRPDRKPKDIPIEIHKKIDDMFYKTYGWRARSKNVAFCWAMPFNYPTFSNLSLFFPVGNYKYLWSPDVEDLFESLEKTFSYDDEVELFAKEILPTYTDKGLKMACTTNHEVMVNCKEYYLIRPELIERVNERFDLRWQGAKFTGRRLS